MARHSRRVLLTGGLAAAAVMVAAGCSSSSSSTSAASGTSTGGSTSGSSSSATGSVIKIGYMVALSGPQASSTASALPTAQAWAKYVNASGGLAGGHQVEIVGADSMGTATGGQSAIQTLVQQDNVQAVMISDPIAEYSVYQSLAKDNIAVLDGSAYGPFWHTTPNFFDTSTDSTATEESSVPAGKAAGATTMAIAACSEVASCAQSAQQIVPVATGAGLKSAGVVTVASTATDYTSQCLAFKQRSADYVYIAIAPQGGARLIASCIQQGYSGLFGDNASSFDQKLFGSVTGMKMVGALNAFPWWSSNAAVVTYRNAMQQYAPSTNIHISQSTATWASLQLLGKALSAKQTTVTRASLLGSMYTIKNETLGGLLPQPVTFTAGQPSAAVNCFWQFKYNAGEANPTSIAPTGTSGNGATGDLATACLSSAS